jgi:hypothetical protein
VAEGRVSRPDGQVENQVGNIREWLFTPLARFASFEALNLTRTLPPFRRKPLIRL